MPSCEKCWADAFHISTVEGRDQVEVYRELLDKRRDDPCSPEEQAGSFWDSEKKVDTRSDGHGGEAADD